MSDDPSSIAAEESPGEPAELAQPPTTAARRAFCRRCGSRLDPTSDVACARCSPSAAIAVAIDGDVVGDVPIALAAPAVDVDEARAIRAAFTLYFTLLAICLAATIAATVSRGDDLHVTNQFVTSGAITVATLGFAVRWRAEFASPLRRSGRPIFYLAAAGLGGCSFVVATGALHVLSSGLGIPQLHYLSAFDHDGFGIGVAILMICVQPAIFEEIAFRGMLFAALRRVLGPAETVVVVALLFGILHLSIPSLFHLTLLGLALGWLRLRSGSLYPCMLMHFTHNLLVLLDERYRWLTWS